jgi:putative transposase
MMSRIRFTLEVGQASWPVFLVIYHQCVVTYYERHLPHWQPEGAALFVTWRLHGSLPRTVEILEKEPAAKTFAGMDRELDRVATGPRWLQDARVAQCVADALQYGERHLRLYELRAWVLMINHVHILIYPEAKLSRITKAVKNFSARQANAILGRTGQPFWQDESWDRWVRGPEELEKMVEYIEENPLAAGLVKRVEDWRWSARSAYRNDRPGGLSHLSPS